MRAPLSNSVRCCSLTWPASGLTRPASICSVWLLPAPDGPNSTSRRAWLRNATSSVKLRCPCVSRLCSEPSHVFASSSRLSGDQTKQKPTNNQKNNKTNNGCVLHQIIGEIVLPGLDRFV